MEEKVDFFAALTLTLTDHREMRVHVLTECVR